MTVDRRDFLKMSGAGLGGLALSSFGSSNGASHSPESDEDHAVLYDATICVGCKACQVACKRRSNLPPDLDSEGIFDAPKGLTADSWTVIELYQEDPVTYSFVKKQCMHCIDPACASGCIVSALYKTDDGPVLYDDDKCIGCRWCMTACPFQVPKYQWEKTVPFVQKCDFCADRQDEGLDTACVASCPTGALLSGKRGELLEVAETRIKDYPDRYVNHLYGKDEVGGTSWLYLAGVAFDKLGLPKPEKLGTISPAQLTWPYMKAVPGIAVFMVGLCTGLYYYFRRGEKTGEEA